VTESARPASSGAALALTLVILGLTISLHSGTTPASAQTASCLPTSERTIGPRGFPGLGVKKVARVHTDALRYARAAGFQGRGAENEAERLNAEGFVSGTSQLYFGTRRKTRGDQGLAFTIQLGSAQQALASFDRVVSGALSRDVWKRFTVDAIPGSVGVRDKARRSGASNVLFTEGQYLYGIGRYVNHRATGAADVSRAAEKLYSRVLGTASCP
jgi:hypothetical protein